MKPIGIFVRAVKATLRNGNHLRFAMQFISIHHKQQQKLIMCSFYLNFQFLLIKKLESISFD